MLIPTFDSKGDFADKYLACRRFTQVVEAASKGAGIEPRQYQLLLAVSQWQNAQPPTIRNLSELLGIRHNTTVELINRTAQRGALARVRDQRDRRQVFLTVTPQGQDILTRIAATVTAGGGADSSTDDSDSASAEQLSSSSAMSATA